MTSCSQQTTVHLEFAEWKIHMIIRIDLLKKTTNQQQKRENITKSQSQNDDTELDGQQEEAGDFPEHLGTHQTRAVSNCAVDCV